MKAGREPKMLVQPLMLALPLEFKQMATFRFPTAVSVEAVPLEVKNTIRFTSQIRPGGECPGSGVVRIFLVHPVIEANNAFLVLSGPIVTDKGAVVIDLAGV